MSCEFCENLNWEKYCGFVAKNEKGEKISKILTHDNYNISPEDQLRFCPCCGAKNPNAPKQFTVVMKVHGKYKVQVEATDWEEAKEKAYECWVDEDFGNLRDIEMGYRSYSSEDSPEEVYL